LGRKELATGVMDGVLKEAANTFGISSGCAFSLLTGLFSYINEQESGLIGVLDRFREIGMGDSVSSWLSGAPKPISNESLERALGNKTMRTIASNTSLSVPFASSALAFMFPKIIQWLAPGGVVVAPMHLPTEFMSCASGPTTAISSGVRRRVAYSTARDVPKPSGLWPILGLALLALVGLWTWHDRWVAHSNVFNPAERVRVAIQLADAALASLKPGFSVGDLSGALNLGIINFASASAELPADTLDFLNRAAKAIKMAPKGTTIEIGGHTDITGNAASNLRLSQQRAEAVRDFLIGQGVDQLVLTAKGYGNTESVATNITEEGRFRNRRIQFTVMR